MLHNLRRRLPAWMSARHPLTRRELRALPHFLSQDKAPNSQRNKLLIMAFFAVALTPFTCTCGGPLWHPAVIALSLAPLIWAVPVIVRDVESGAWDTLRLTPYSARDLLLAKLYAVVYRLSPLLAFLLAGQAVFSLLAMSGSVILLAGVGSSVSYSTGTATLDLPVMDALQTIQSAGAGVLLALVGVIHVLLDFALSAAIGAAMAVLSNNRTMGYVLGLILRGVLTVLLLLVTVVLVGLFNGGGRAGPETFGMALLFGAPGWALSGFWATPLATGLGVLVVGGVIAALQVALFQALVAVTAWRAEQLQTRVV